MNSLRNALIASGDLINARTVTAPETRSQTYAIVAPPTPGAAPRWVGGADTIADAEAVAARFGADRPDLRGQDVRIEYATSGRLVRRAGPSR